MQHVSYYFKTEFMQSLWLSFRTCVLWNIEKIFNYPRIVLFHINKEEKQLETVTWTQTELHFYEWY